MKWLTLAVLLLTFSACSHYDKNPRSVNGKYYLRTADSVYYITFKIDSVIPMEYEREDRRP